MTSENEEYQRLAIEVIAERASASEKARLKSILKAKPELEDDFRELKRALLEDAGVEFAELLLKSLMGRTTAEEAQELSSLARKDPARWGKCIEFALTLQVVAESLQKARTSPPHPAKMPDHVRERLMANLRASRGKSA